MIGDGAGKGWQIAIRDAGIVFGSAFLGVLAAFGFPPGWEAVYAAAVAGGIAFIASLRTAFGIAVPTEEG